MAVTDSIIGAESGGNPYAQNPRSSAGGLGQFIDSTWLETLAKHRPDITGSREELLALKFDPKLSQEMTEARAADNGKILSNAGLPVTPGTTYLAHFAGPQGAVNALRADPNTPVEQILGPQAMAANPFLKGMTAAGLQAWADKKMGGSTPSISPAPAAAAAPANGIPSLSPPPVFAPPPSGPQQKQPEQAPEMMPPPQPIQQPVFAPMGQMPPLALNIPRPRGNIIYAKRR